MCVELDSVGQNMTDHLFLSPVYKVTNNITTFGHFGSNALLLAEGFVQYKLGEGKLTGAISSMSTFKRVPDDVLSSIGATELECQDLTLFMLQVPNATRT